MPGCRSSGRTCAPSTTSRLPGLEADFEAASTNGRGPEHVEVEFERPAHAELQAAAAVRLSQENASLAAPTGR